MILSNLEYLNKDFDIVMESYHNVDNPVDLVCLEMAKSARRADDDFLDRESLDNFWISMK